MRPLHSFGPPRSTGGAGGPHTGGGSARASRRAAPDEVASFLARPTGLLLRSSGEGAALIERTVRHTARALGAEASVLLVPDGAQPAVTSPSAEGG
ncbi:hypothetical protein AB0D33_10035 [Streptomyces sp. NPDC048404]|uniref:hypothetical protein n=1 Tax=unclassified Streptomyces TaxID=2593676 RepID=UPI0034149695